LTIKNGDFVNLDYTGSYEGKVFDTTLEDVAKKEGIYSDKTKYGSVTIIVGTNQILKGLDEAIVGKKEGETFEVKLPPEKAFGRKNAKLLKIIPQKLFKEQKVNPYPGMTVNIDNMLGTIVSVSAGRIIVDFNHPLSGRELDYKVKINKVITDKKEQVKSLVELYIGEGCKTNINDKKVVVKCSKEIPEKVKSVLENDIKKYIKLDVVEFVKETNQKENKS